MLSAYEEANLIPLLDTIRKPGRYAGLNGVNALTNAAFGGNFSKPEITRELRHAVAAGQECNHSFVPTFTHPRQGFSYGLNPYTDWSLAQLNTRPSHWYLFLGLDWYAISGLGHTESWFEYLANPFLDTEDRYWQNVWAWILQKYQKGANGTLSWQTPISEQEAAAFIRKDGGGFIFHNRIPFLRPAGYESAGSEWYEAEWKKPSVRQDAIEDLRVLRQQTGERIVAITTGQDSVNALIAAGFNSQRIISWKAHPSRVFHPSRFVKENFWFKGREYFRT